VLKVMTIVGTRPEIIRLSRVIAMLDLHCTHTLVHTGQNYDYELNEVFFEQLKVRAPDRYLSAAGATAAETIAQIIATADKVLEEVKPDAVLILGDTNSSLAAIAAKRRKIPISIWRPVTVVSTCAYRKRSTGALSITSPIST